MEEINKKEKKKLKKEKGKEKKVVKNTLENSKVAQMIFKTAIRNHLDLSSLADSKASTMLSINTLIITIALPFMLPRIEEYPVLLYPALIVLITCAVSTVFAIMVTKPHKMTGYTDENTLLAGKGDLFFFGNFFKMNFEQYKTGMDYTIENNQFLNDTVTRDLFSSGKALGAKYQKLRVCYTIFMVGLITATLLFLTLSLI